MDWEPYLTDCTYSEKSKRAKFFCAVEMLKWRVHPVSVRGKLSAIRWMHVKDNRPDPFKELKSLTSWLADRIKEAPPTGKKGPASLSLLEFILLHTDS